MGRRIGRSAARLWGSLLRTLARRLDGETRDAVLGDLEEAGVRDRRAVVAVAGLLIRRATMPWTSWRPWLAMLTLALPIGLTMAFVSRWWIDHLSIDAFFYIENWTPAYLQSPGARRDLFDAIIETFMRAAALIGWAWVTGRALSLMSCRTRRTLGATLALVVLAGAALTTTTARANGANAFVFGTAFYGVMLPVLAQVFLILLPAGFAMMRPGVASGRGPVVALAVGIAALTTAMAPAVESALVFGSHGVIARPDAGADGVFGTSDDGRPLWLMGYVFLWPVAAR